MYCIKLGDIRLCLCKYMMYLKPIRLSFFIKFYFLTFPQYWFIFPSLFSFYAICTYILGVYKIYWANEYGICLSATLLTSHLQLHPKWGCWITSWERVQCMLISEKANSWDVEAAQVTAGRRLQNMQCTCSVEHFAATKGNSAICNSQFNPENMILSATDSQKSDSGWPHLSVKF